jgi:hypothetical protein
LIRTVLFKQIRSHSDFHYNLRGPPMGACEQVALSGKIMVIRESRVLSYGESIALGQRYCKADGLQHAGVVGYSLAGDIKGRAVVDRSSNEG